MTHRMTFDEFQEMNARRCREVWRETLDNGWTLDDWAHRLSEEVGEVCRVFTRVRDGRIPPTSKRGELLKELADVICMADLMITALHANTVDTVMEKFNEVSDRHEWLDEKKSQWRCGNCGGNLFNGMDHTCPPKSIALAAGAAK